MHIAFTGSRVLTDEQVQNISDDFAYFISTKAAIWHVGCANGLDALVREKAKYYDRQLHVYEVEGCQPYHFAQRTKRMIDGIARKPDPSWLYAFPNKLCPGGCRPSKNPNGHGSGTWLAIAYARYLKIPIYFFPQFKTRPLDHSWKPDWMNDEPTCIQMTLF
jgi:hypothetical protein